MLSLKKAFSRSMSCHSDHCLPAPCELIRSPEVSAFRIATVSIKMTPELNNFVAISSMLNPHPFRRSTNFPSFPPASRGRENGMEAPAKSTSGN